MARRQPTRQSKKDDDPIFPSSGGSHDSLLSNDSLDKLDTSDSGNSSLNSNGDSIHVVIRVRPLNSKEIKFHDSSVVSFPGDGQILLNGLNSISGPNGPKSKLFSFNVVFETRATQEDVFNFCGIKKLIDMAVEGFNTTCFCYGQTGSGKTHTLTGPPGVFFRKKVDPYSPSHGLVFRSFLHLFQILRNKSDLHFVLKASFLEIYNEKVIDLLNTGSCRKPLAVRWSKKSRSFFVENLFTVDCEELDDLQAVLEEGMRNRSVGCHNMNEYSSRSHTILTVHITSEQQMPDSGVFITRQGKINFVDLAGSEMTKKTKSSGKTLEEANNINKSLMVLGYCIASLSDPKKRGGHIPYRDSKLTKLLADSLAGSGVTLMIACVSPALSNVSETINTLRYAARAKRIRTRPIIVMDPRETLIVSLKREVQALQNENEHLRIALDLSRAYAADVERLSGSREFSLKTPPHIDLEKIAEMEGSELVDLIKHYAVENEALRKENAELFNSRDMLMRDHEIVCRENERLLKKLEDVNKACVRSPLIPARTSYSADNGPSHDESGFSDNLQIHRNSAGAILQESRNESSTSIDKQSNELPDSIQKEMIKKGIGKTISNIVETLKSRKTSGKKLLNGNESNSNFVATSKSSPAKDNVSVTSVASTMFDVFGSPVSSARRRSVASGQHETHSVDCDQTHIHDKSDIRLPNIYDRLPSLKEKKFRDPFGSPVSPIV